MMKRKKYIIPESELFNVVHLRLMDGWSANKENEGGGSVIDIGGGDELSRRNFGFWDAEDDFTDNDPAPQSPNLWK